MPQLPQYTAQIGDLPISGGRRASAEEFGVGAAALGGLAKVGSKVGEQVMDRTEEEESRKALVQSSEIRAKYARLLDDAQSNGGDLDKLKESMANELSTIGDGFQTRKGAESLSYYSTNTELMFDEQSNRIAVTRAASTARLDAGKFMTSASSVIQSNPTYLGTAIKDAEALIDGFQKVPPEKKAELKAELRQNLNMTAALASARLDPKGTREKLDTGEWELSAEQRNLAVNKTEEQINARRAAENHARATADYERRQRDEKATHGYMTKIVDGTLTGKQLERAITGDPDLDSNSVRTLTLFAEHRADELVKGANKSHEPTKRDLWLRVYAPDGAPNKIYNHTDIVAAVAAGRLNTTDANALMAGVAGQKDENGRAFGTRLQGRLMTVQAVMRGSPEYANQPELSAAIQLEMVAQVEKKAAAMRAANQDPSVLLDPDHKDSYFKPGIVKSVAEDVKRRAAADLPQAVTVTTQAEYDALPPDTPYVDSKGQRGVKKGPAKVAAPVTVPPDARSYYEQNRDKYGPQAAMSFDRLMDLLGGTKPTRETTAEYDRRKAGL
jgi:hypothetical protein